MKRFEIWAEFPDGCEAKIESWKSLKCGGRNERRQPERYGLRIRIPPRSSRLHHPGKPVKQPGGATRPTQKSPNEPF